MALDRQYLVEILDAQGQQVGVLSASRINVVDSKITRTTPGTATSIATYAGNGQSGTVGANIAIPPAVRVTDANGLPVAGSTVTWFHGGGSGTTSTGTVTTTNSNGVSQVGTWSLGTTAGSVYTIFAYSGNLTNSPIRFSCTPTAGSAFSISASRGTSQTSTPLGTMPSSLSACVHDQYGNPVNGASVTVTTTDDLATIGSAALTTSSNGHAGTTYQAGHLASVASVLFAISSTTSTRFDMTTVAGPATSVDIVSGLDQVAAIGEILTNPIVVAVDDGFGNQISSGETLQFVVVQGSGTISRATATPVNSQSSFTWAVGAGAGQNAVEISLQNLSNSTVTVFASGTNPLADTIFAVAGTGQSVTVGAALGAPIRWGVTGSGASASGQVVDLSVTGDAVLSTAQTTSTATGLVNVTVTAGTVASIYTVTATAAGLAGSPSKITFEGVAGSATSLIVQTQPTSNPVPGVAWPQQPVIISTDVYGNLVSTNTRVGAVLTSGDGTLASSVSMFAVASGATANFSGLSYTQVATNAFQVVYRCNSLSTATGDPQTAQPPFATKLGFTVQPTGGVEGSSIGQVVVAVQDSTGATVGNATDPVTLDIGTNPSGGVLSGTATVAASGGLATFNGLTINLAGTDYTLNATAAGLTGATSAAFTMTAASTAHPNEPAGMTQLTLRQFNAKPAASPATGNPAVEDGWIDRGDANSTCPHTDATSPGSPSNVQRCRFPINYAAGGGPVKLEKFWAGNFKNTVYVSYWIKIDSAMYGTSKLGYVRCGTSTSNYRDSIYLKTGSIDGETRNGFQVACFVQGGGVFGNGTAGIYPAALYAYDQWHRIELLLTVNPTDGATDGSCQLWVNGTQRVNTGLKVRGTGTLIPATSKWVGVNFNPTYDHTSPIDTPNQNLWYIYLDDYYASGKD